MIAKIQTERPTEAVRGFTLIELLVVIVIIITLAVLSMVGISRFRKSAYRSVSMGNLKALQVANASYATDHGGVFVGTFARDEDGKVSSIWVSSQDFLDDYLGAAEKPSSGNMEDRVPVSALDPVAYRAKKSGYSALKASYGSVSKEQYTKAGPNSNSAYT